MPRWRRWPAVAGALAGIACFPARAPNCGAVPPADGCTRVLFIGNSYTSVNDLPGTFVRVAAKHGHAVFTEMIAPGGLRLADHAASSAVLEKIRAGHWTYVVLQEQSLVPSMEQARQEQMYPAARALVRAIRQAGARPVFYATWARRNGWPENGMPDYAPMQVEVTRGYRTIAEELHAIVAPVGDAWATIVVDRPDIPLWQGDGSHPTEQGTFLAANVLLAAIFHEVPRGLGSRGHVPEVHVYSLQQAAAHAVLGAPTTQPRQ